MNIPTSRSNPAGPLARCLFAIEADRDRAGWEDDGADVCTLYTLHRGGVGKIVPHSVPLSDQVRSLPVSDAFEAMAVMVNVPGTRPDFVRSLPVDLLGVAVCSEAWGVYHPDLQDPTPPSEHPDRQELRFVYGRLTDARAATVQRVRGQRCQIGGSDMAVGGAVPDALDALLAALCGVIVMRRR